MRKIFFFLAFVLLACPLFAKKVVIYHTSDTHGVFYPQNGVGGFAALKSLLDKETLPYILLDSGDFSDGSLEAARSKGIKSIEMMNAVGYGAAVLGNHDFYFNNEGVFNIIKKANFPILAANVFDKQTKKLIPGVSAYKIFDTGDVKIGVIGIAKGDARSSFKFTSPLPTLKKTLPELEAQKPDFIVVLTHYPVNDGGVVKESTEKYAEEFGSRINLVLGGHMHKEALEKINGVYYVESVSHLKKAGRVEVEFDDKTNKIISVKTELIPLIVSKTGENAEIKALAETLRIPGIDGQIGSAAQFISEYSTSKQCPDSQIDNLLADLFVKYSGADIGIMNISGSTGNFLKGPITQRDTLMVFPFDNRLMTAEIDGVFLKKVILSAIPSDGRSKLNYSGLEVKYKKFNGKTKDLVVLFKGAEIEDNKKYKVAGADFILNGKGEGYLFKQISDKNYVGDKTIRSILEEEVKKGVPLKAPDVCRIQVAL